MNSLINEYRRDGTFRNKYENINSEGKLLELSGIMSARNTFAIYKRRSPAEEWRLIGDWNDELMACSLARAHINIDHSRGFPEVEALVIKVDASCKPPETVGEDAIKDCVLWACDGTHDPKFIELTERIDREMALQEAMAKRHSS